MMPSRRLSIHPALPNTPKRPIMSDIKTNDLNVTNSGTIKDQLSTTGADMKRRASDALQTSTDAAREKLRDTAEAAKAAASQTVDRVQEQARQKQHAGADYIGRFAGNLREAAKAFQSDVPLAANGIQAAADYVDDAAERVRQGSPQDLVEAATD